MNAVRTRGPALLVCSVVLCLATARAHADGTEVLGPPSIPIASGTHIIGAGTGTYNGPGVINLNVPLGVTVKQAILYWEGFANSSVTGDNEILVNGTFVTGDLIGGPTNFFSGAWAFTYRADITAQGWVNPGANNITIGGFDFGTANNGAGILVIYDDGTPTAQIGLRDGSDLAYRDFTGNLKVTVPQTFNFAPAAYDRVADVVMFVASVDVNVTSLIRITSGGIVTDIPNILGNTDGPQWDTVSSTVPIPANTDSITFEIISGPNSPPPPASLDWLTASFAILPAPVNGTIIIKALTVPPGGTGFTFTDDIRAPNGFVLNHGEMEMFLEVPAGDYQVDEADPTITPGGWSLVDLVCVDTDAGGVDSTVDLASGVSTIHLEPGETVTCTYTHVPETGTVVITKDTIPAGGTDFDFSNNIAAPSAFALDDGQSRTFLNVAAGSYSVTELDPTAAGWSLSGLVCTDTDPAGTPSTGNVATRTATINVEPGETVQCTFTNIELPGTVIINKITSPSGGANFGFANTIAAPANFNLSDGGSRTFLNVAAGAYTVSENDPGVSPGGFDLSGLTCTDSVVGGTPSTTDVLTRTANINVDPGETVTCTFVNSAPQDCRVSVSEKGSFLLWSKVDVRWTAAGELIQDTFVDLTNDFPGDVCVQMYFINGDEPLDAVLAGDTVVERAHPGWNNVDVQICLTANQPTYWSAATGLAGAHGIAVSPFTVLDPGTPPGRPDPEGSPDRVLRGYIVGWAVNALGEEIRWNHLKGDALIVNYANGSAWEYSAWTAQALNVAHGSTTLGPAGELNLDGREYCPAYDLLLLDFYAAGSSPFESGDLPGGVSLNGDLTLLPVSADLRQETAGPVTTKASFTVWNENETKLTGMDQCITCWDERLFTSYGIPNHFLRENLQTDKGKAQIDGLASQRCDQDFDPVDGLPLGGDPRDVRSVRAALLGVVSKWVSFGYVSDRAVADKMDVAGMNLIGMGAENATIRADLIGVDPPERPETPRTPVDTDVIRIERKSSARGESLRSAGR